MIKKGVLIVLFVFLIAELAWSAPQTRIVKYTFLENFLGWIIEPEFTPADKTLPLIIYNYDETFDWLGEKAATEQGYNLHHFMREFTRRGYMGFIPIERYRKLKAIKGAIIYVSNHPKVDKDNIHMIGVSEGAFMSMLTDKYQKRIRSISLISPRPLNDKGHFSLPALLKNTKKMEHVPIFIGNGTKNRRWVQSRVELAREILVQNGYPVFYKEYNYGREWFWSPVNSYMNDIFDFIKRNSKR